jgi:hypothetical protein
MTDIFISPLASPVVVTRRLPYMANDVPAVGTLGVPLATDMTFTITTDNLAATSIVMASVNLQVNGVPVVVAGVVVTADYVVTLTPGTRLIDVVLSPVAGLQADTVYRVDGQMTDNLGNHGVDWYEFSTGTVAFAMQIDRSEPLACPVDTADIPMFTTAPNVTTGPASDTVSSITTDWQARGVTPYDEIVLDGPNAGRWIVRDVSGGPARLFRVNRTASSTMTAQAFRRQEFADRNPVGLVLSPLLDYPLARAWGDTADRYLGGHASDLRFPLAFYTPPAAVFHDSIGPTPSASPGGSFDDQTNKRLDFQLWGNPATTGIAWDRYSVALEAAVKPVLTGSVTVTAASATVTGAGTAFLTEMHVGARVTFGTDTTQYRVSMIPDNSTLVLTDPWAGGTLAGQTVHRAVTGTRVLQVVQVDQWPAGCEFFVGLANTGNSPTTDGNDRVGCSFSISQNERVTVRTHVGTVSTANTTIWTVPAFLGRPWVVEVEMTGESRAVTRLATLDEPGTEILAFTTETTGSVVPVLDRWTCTTLATGQSLPGARVIGSVRYVDVEPGTGVVYGTAGVDSSEAKARPAHNVTWLDLVEPAGWKTLDLQVAFTAFEPNQYDRIFWDTDPNLVKIDSIEVEGGAVTTLAGQQAHKFSLHQGFDQIDLTFRASRRGHWYCLVDTHDVRTGRILAQGPYDVAGAVQAVRVFGEQFEDLPDGPHEIVVVVCRNPIVTDASSLIGSGSLVVQATRTRVSGASLAGIGTLNVLADVVPASEELLAVIENESSQVNGTAVLFTTSVPYVAGKLKVWLDGVLQNFNPPGRVTETSPGAGTFTLSSAPRSGQKLVVEFVPL